MSDLTLHHYEFMQTPGSDRTLLMLHGTGGNEHSLRDLGRSIDASANLLSPRGNVLEHGMPRFFRRIAEGVFDEDDIRRRASDLSAWLQAARREHALTSIVAVGYSNGANIAAATLLMNLPGIDHAILIRAMAPFVNPPTAVSSSRVLLLSGTSDLICPAPTANKLATDLRATGASVQHQWLSAGHNLIREDLTKSQHWLST